MLAGFAPDYFGSTMPGASPATPAGVVPSLNDAGILRWVKQQLVDSGLFAWIGVGRSIAPQGIGDFPGAWIYPVSFVESDEVDPCSIVRTLRFAIGISVAAPIDDDLAAMDDLDRLSNSTANIITGDGPDGYLPGCSRIENGRYDTIPTGKTAPIAGTVYSGLTLTASIAYLVEGRTGRTEDD